MHEEYEIRRSTQRFITPFHIFKWKTGKKTTPKNFFYEKIWNFEFKFKGIMMQWLFGLSNRNSSISYVRRNVDKNIYYHLDSANGLNDSNAQEIAFNLSNFVGFTEKPNRHYSQVPQQENGHDCGIFKYARWPIAIAIDRGRLRNSSNEGAFPDACSSSDEM